LSLATVNDVLLTAIGRANPHVARYKDATGAWAAMDSAELSQRVRKCAGALRGMGVGKGDRVAILSENRWEWHATDFATLALGAVDVPLYPTSTAEQLAFMLRDSGAKVMALSSREQYQKVSAIRDATHLERILVMDEESLPGAEKFSDALAGAVALSESELEQCARAVQPDDLATIIYTSGTTGEPKGVMLTHGNIASNLNYSTELFHWDMTSSGVSFLPLSHITARALDYAMFLYGASLAYCSSFADLPKTMQEIRPTVIVAVPRVYEKVRQGVEAKVTASRLKKHLYDWAIGIGGKYREQILRGEKPSSLSYKLASKLVLSKVHGAFGGRVVHFLSGGAPLGMDTAGWFADVGIRIFEGYGLTETSPVISLNNPQDHRIGSVGKLLPNVEVRFAEDGEILVRGPSVFAGYWNNQGATDEAFAATSDVIPGETSAEKKHVIPSERASVLDVIPSERATRVEEPASSFDFSRYRWFHTGDIGQMDADGFLYITDRKKEMLKTSGGKFIAPAPIENKIKGNVLVGQSAMVGDKRKYASLIISPNFAALEVWARAKGIKFSNREELVANPRVVAEYRGIVANVNAGLAQYETIKRFHVVPEEWTLETGELTPSMKLKRRIINQNYEKVIQDFYLDEATSKK
jgi:long-chain acyl-CoA synthetase